MYKVRSYPNTKMTFSVRPVRDAAMASMKVVSPNEAWIGTKAARNAAVEPSQQRRTRKLKKPNTN